MIPIVTTLDEKYLPGLKALYNSYMENSRDGFSFHAVVDGTEEFAAHIRHDLGIDVIRNPEIPAKRIYLSEKWPQQILYYRLLVPMLFKGSEKSIYIDADSVILQSLKPLVDTDMGERPVGATRSNSSVKKEIPNWEGPDFTGPISSFFLFNHRYWFEKRVWERCVELIESRPDLDFQTTQQAILQVVLRNDWHEFPWETQAHAGHKTLSNCRIEDVFILHFLGTNPWDELRFPGQHKEYARKIWRRYA